MLSIFSLFLFNDQHFFPKQNVTDSSVVHAHAINGIFRIGKHSIDFQSTSFKRFQVAVAFSLGGSIHLMFAFTAHKDGISCRLLQQQIENHEGAYKIPSDLKSNTALIIGISPADQKSVLNFQMNGIDIDGNVTWNNINQNVEINGGLIQDQNDVTDQGIGIDEALAQDDVDDNNETDDDDDELGKQIVEWLIDESLKI